MMFDLHPDPLGSASHLNMAGHLPGPFAGGAVHSNVAVKADGTIEVERSTREPVLLIGPLKSLDDVIYRVSAVLDPGGAATALNPVLEFFSYTEGGAFLPLYIPPVDPDIRTAAPFTVKVKLELFDRDGIRSDWETRIYQIISVQTCSKAYWAS